MQPEEDFEQALQMYERAVAEYKIAWRRYVEIVGLHNAQPKLEEAMNRICRLDQTPLIIMSQEEVNARALRGTQVVDAFTSPDIYAHRPEYGEGNISHE